MKEEEEKKPTEKELNDYKKNIRKEIELKKIQIENRELDVKNMELNIRSYNASVELARINSIIKEAKTKITKEENSKEGKVLVMNKSLVDTNGQPLKNK